MATFVVRRAEDSGQKQVELELGIARSESYERHLTSLGIHPNDYDKVYELAERCYVEDGIKGPFGIDEILKGANKFLEKNNLPKEFTVTRKEKIDCPTCSSTGIQFDASGKIIYEKIEGKKRAKRCLDCENNEK